MDFKWRLESKENFYNVLSDWWRMWGFPIIPYEALPMRIFVVSKNNTDLYAIPVYITDSDVCWIAYPTSNRCADKELKTGAFQYLLGVVEIAMKYQGFNRLTTTSDTPKLMEMFEECGFIASDLQTNHYTKLI